MLWLRVIAAGITMPFFVLPLFVSALCLVVWWHEAEPDPQLVELALFLSVAAGIVGAYFHWSIVPAREPASPTPRRAK